MPLKVFSCCTYSTSPLGRGRTREQWAALHFVRAIKGLPLKNYAYVPLPNGARGYLDQRRCRMAADWFGQMAASRVTWDRLGPLTLVPVPDAACGLSVERVPKVVPLAEALVRALPAGKATVLDVLRWARPMPTAHQADGTRDPQELYGRLRLARPQMPPDDARAVLIDDVLASGGHLRAAAAFLRDCGAHVVAAVCAGRADDAEPADLEPFRTRTDVLPDFVSDPDWLLPLVYDGVDL